MKDKRPVGKLKVCTPISTQNTAVVELDGALLYVCVQCSIKTHMSGVFTNQHDYNSHNNVISVK